METNQITDNNDGVFLGSKDSTAGTTTFLNDAQVSVTNVRATPNYLKGLDDSAVIGYNQDIKQFLEKPIIYTSGVWTSTTPGGILFTANLEDYFNIPLVKNKLSGFVGVRGTFVIRLQVNATKFQQGRIVGCFVPSADIAGVKPSLRIRNLMAATQLPRVELDLATDTSVTIEVPYISPCNFYNLSTQQGPWGNMYFIIYGEKQSGAAPYDAGYTVFISLEKAEFVMPGFIAESGNGPVIRRRNVTDEEAKISSSLSAMSRAATQLNKVPILGNFAGTASWVLEAMAGSAKAFGFSKPTIQSDVQKRVIDQTTNMANFNKADPGDCLGLDAENKVDVLTTLGGAPDDEVAVAYVAQRMAYFNTARWTTSAAAGEMLFNLTMNPGDYRIMRTDPATNGQPYWDYTPLAFVSSLFYWWRGSIKFTLKFVKTPFHSGRLLVAFNPTLVDFTSDNTNYMLREIIDIRECTEYTFSVPYMSVKQYSATTPFHDGSPAEITGFLRVFVLNELNAPASVANNIDIILEVGGGSDIEFAMPSTTTDDVYIPGAFVAEGDISGLTTAQPVLKSDHGLGSASIDPGCIEPAQYCMGERVLSLYQLMKRYHHARNRMNFVSPDFGKFSQATFRPFAITCSNNSATSPEFQGPSACTLNTISACYAFSRGSIRFMLKPNPLVSDSVLLPMKAYITNNRAVASDAIFNTAPVDHEANLGTKLVNFPETRILNLLLPSYNNLKCRINKLQCNDHLYGIDDYDSPVVLFVEQGFSNSVQSDVYMAAGDDYQLSYFLGIPPIFYYSGY